VNAAMFPKTIANAFDRPFAATLIEAIVGSVILQDVLDERNPNPNPKSKRKSAAVSNAQKPRRQRMFDHIKANGKTSSSDVAKIAGIEATNAHADLNAMCHEGKLLKEPGLSKWKRKCTYFWVNPDWIDEGCNT
jgi:hypothetical protein